MISWAVSTPPLWRGLLLLRPSQSSPPIEPPAGMWFWLNSNTIVAADGASLSSVPDSSPNLRDLAQTTPALRPVYRATDFAGDPCVQFNGQWAQNTLSPVSYVAANGFYAAFTISVLSTLNIFTLENATPSPTVFTSSVYRVLGYFNGNSVFSPANSLPAGIHFVEIVATAGDTDVQMFVDEVLIASFNNPASLTALRAITLGAYVGGTFTGNCLINQFLVYPGDLFASVQSGVRDYIASL